MHGDAESDMPGNDGETAGGRDDPQCSWAQIRMSQGKGEKAETKSCFLPFRLHIQVFHIIFACS